MRAWLAICASIGALTRARDPRAADQLAELCDARGIALDPALDRRVGILVAAAREEIDPQLLEVAGQAGGQQPLPLVGGNEARDLLLRPVEPERFAEPDVGAGQGQLVDPLREPSAAIPKTPSSSNRRTSRGRFPGSRPSR